MEEHNADTTSATPTPRTLTSNASNYALNGKIMLSSVIILFTAVSLIACFHSYVRWLFLRHRRNLQAALPAASASTSSAPSGLNPSVLKALPTFVYLEDDKGAGDRSSPLECSVCLSEFEDKEEGRALPRCKHVFHLECIDVWFGSHSTCPLCRAPVELELEQSGKLEDGGSSSCSGSSGDGLEVERRMVEMVGVHVEVPPLTREEIERSRRGLVDLGLGSPARHCSPKSPADQVFTLKRIWSV